MKGYYSELLHGKDKAKSRAHNAGFNLLFKSSRKTERVIAAVDEPLPEQPVTDVCEQQLEKKDNLEEKPQSTETNKKVSTVQARSISSI